MPGQPDWCGWWTHQEWVRFCWQTQLATRQAGRPGAVDVERGVLAWRDGGEQSLEDLAGLCRDEPPERWPAVIRAHLAPRPGTPDTGRTDPGDPPAGAGSEPDGTGPTHSGRSAPVELSELRSALLSLVVSTATGGVAEGVTRPLGADLVELLVVGRPEGFALVDPAAVERWGVDPADLFAIGRENVRAEPVRRRTLDELGLYELHHHDGGPAASRLPLLGGEPGVGRYGCLVVLPYQDTLIYHPIEGSDCLGHTAAWLTLVRAASDDTRPGRLSDRLYWWYGEQVTEIPATLDGNELQVRVPGVLTELLGAVDPAGRPETATDPADSDRDRPADSAGDRPIDSAGDRSTESMAVDGDVGLAGYVGARLLAAGRWGEAERWLRRAAEGGDAEATCNLGVVLLRTGRADEAERRFRHALEQGHRGAKTNLAALLDAAGRAAEAERWFRAAAYEGDAHAMHMLSRVLDRTGRADEAEPWLRRAAEAVADSGVTAPMVELGDRLAAAERYRDAEPWLRRAAERGDPEGMFKLGLVLGWSGHDDGAAEWLERAAAHDHAEAADIAGRWFRLNAEGGVVEDMRRLGRLLRIGGDPQEAEAWLRRAVEANDPEAARELGLLREQAGDTADAERWYRSAAARGEVSGMTDLGRLLRRSGRLDEAERWVTRAAELGSTVAMRHLGDLRLDEAAERRAAGEPAVAEAATADARRWFRTAADAGDAEAMYAVGLLAERQSRDDARDWFRQAAEAGHSGALDRLAELAGRS